MKSTRTLPQMNSISAPSSGVAVKVSIIALTAVLYAVGKGITAYVPTPFSVGQLLVGIFLPAFLAVVADTLSVAVGAGFGTFIGDVLFLVPLGATTPVLSLLAGVPANFIGFLLFGWFVKKYSSWGGFVAATISFVTLGNLIAAVAVFLFIPLPTSVILGLTVFWNTTSIPAIIVAVPILIRAVRPLFGRSKIISYEPQWASSVTGRQSGIALFFAVVFLILGAAFFVLVPNPGLASSLKFDPLYFAIAAVIVIIFAPISSVIAGTRLQAKQTA